MHMDLCKCKTHMLTVTCKCTRAHTHTRNYTYVGMYKPACTHLSLLTENSRERLVCFPASCGQITAIPRFNATENKILILRNTEVHFFFSTHRLDSLVLRGAPGNIPRMMMQNPSTIAPSVPRTFYWMQIPGSFPLDEHFFLEINERCQSRLLDKERFSIRTNFTKVFL